MMEQLSSAQLQDALAIVREVADLSEYPFQEKPDKVTDSGVPLVTKEVDQRVIRRAHNLLASLKVKA